MVQIFVYSMQNRIIKIFVGLKFRTRATFAPHPRKFSVQRSHVFKGAKFLNVLFSYRKYSYEIYEILHPTKISRYTVLEIIQEKICICIILYGVIVWGTEQTI